MKARFGGCRMRRHRKGGNIFKSAWNGIKKVAGLVHDTMKKRKVISGALRELPVIGPGAAAIASHYGYGRRGLRSHGKRGMIIKGRGRKGGALSFNPGYVKF